MTSYHWVKHRRAVEQWKLRNREYYLRQKRELAGRPEYLAHRRVMYASKHARPNDVQPDLSTTINDNEERDARAN